MKGHLLIRSSLPWDLQCTSAISYQRTYLPRPRDAFLHYIVDVEAIATGRAAHGIIDTLTIEELSWKSSSKDDTDGDPTHHQPGSQPHVDKFVNIKNLIVS
jgi:hypothetical protein